MLTLHLNLHEQHAVNKGESYHLNRVYTFQWFTFHAGAG